MKSFSFQEFKPTILFLSKFIGFYLVANLLYGFYVTAYHPAPDPATHWVSHQTSVVLSACGWPTTIRDNSNKPTTSILYEEGSILSVYEGCNGINVMIIFVAFVIAFGSLLRSMLWFIPLGLLIIHVMNLARISLLFFVAEYMPRFMYFTHKYLFTAIIYVVVFILWVWWVKKFAIRKT
jgi:exosortase family protein XrtF